MRQRTFTLGVVTAAIAATCAFGMPAASAAPTHHFWLGYAGSSAVADTVAEDLLQGNSVGQAQALASELASLTTPTTAAVINRALDQDATGHDHALAETLLDFVAAPATNRATGPSDVVAPAAAAGTEARLAASANSQVAVASSEPAQATHGDPKAIGLYYWILHNNKSTPIFYGNCSPEGCVTGGYFIVDDESAVGSAPEVMFSSSVRQGGGQGAAFSNSTVRAFQDVSGGDPVKFSTTCPVAYGNTKISCSTFPKVSGSVGGWYYFRQDFTASTAIAGCGDIQIQTRRWKVVSSTNYEFIAAQYGG